MLAAELARLQEGGFNLDLVGFADEDLDWLLHVVVRVAHLVQGVHRGRWVYWSTFIIWAKNSFTLGRSDYQRQYEPILYGWREGTEHHWCGRLAARATCGWSTAPGSTTCTRP
ncbi:MAG: DNA modification methylase [Xanthobacteraceae bacterium]|nr:MAG: DNA modification methylase [Xanthobacteraceae bacterium]